MSENQPVRVLLADDHRVVRAGLTAILNESGRALVVAQANDGAQALDILADQDQRMEIDIVLLDLQMPPGLDGLSALKQLRARGDAIPVLILTTYETDADIVSAMEAGASGYLLKDAQDNELLEAVEKVARGHKALAPQVADRIVERMSSRTQALSARELEILELLADGLSNKEIAERSFVSQATVKTHLVHIFNKLGAESRTQAISIALERRLIRAH